MQSVVEQALYRERRTRRAMKMDFFESLAALESNPELHCARLLILLEAFATDEGTGEVEGLTKLAKLDFLLRYPVMLERALLAKRQSTRAVAVEEQERHSVEYAMVRYRFGPWDPRYREFLNILVAKGLVNISVEGRKVTITATASGREVAARLAN